MKYIIPVLIALIVGFFFSYYVFNQYESKEKIKTIFSDNNKVNFIQYGVYSTKESMEENTKALNYYIYNVIDNKYYVYIGISKSNIGTEKLKGYFKELGYDIYVKELSLSNNKFITTLEQYDLLLENTNDKDTIKTICNQVLAKYEEMNS